MTNCLMNRPSPVRPDSGRDRKVYFTIGVRASGLASKTRLMPRSGSMTLSDLAAPRLVREVRTEGFLQRRQALRRARRSQADGFPLRTDVGLPEPRARSAGMSVARRGSCG